MVPIRYHVKIVQKANPYLSEFDAYFEKRVSLRKRLALECKQNTTFVYSGKNNSRVYPNKVGFKSA